MIRIYYLFLYIVWKRETFETEVPLVIPSFSTPPSRIINNLSPTTSGTVSTVFTGPDPRVLTESPPL